MLDNLPIEVLQHVISHLSTVSDICNLSSVNRTLHARISSDEHAIFCGFVQASFPSIKTPPLWGDAARVLTSRSRAWDRKAFVARQVVPPKHTSPVAPDVGRSGFGHAPVVDTYGEWHGPAWSDNKEVLAWGTMGRLRLRTTDKTSVTWSTWQTPDDHLPRHDILDARLLRPHQNPNANGESIILRRANAEVIKVDYTATSNSFTTVSNYVVATELVDCVDISLSSDPVLAVGNRQSLQIFPINTTEPVVQPVSTVLVSRPYKFRWRQRATRFLSDTRLALSLRLVDGLQQSPINVYDISPCGLSSSPLISYQSVLPNTPPGPHSANVLTPITTGSSNASQIFLSGWTDGIIRVHDIRDPSLNQSYSDPVDDGQISSIAIIGCERFFAGSHQNACLKVFDLRMSGGRLYSHVDLGQHTSFEKKTTAQPIQADTASEFGLQCHREFQEPQRDLNIFLSVPFPQPKHRRPSLGLPASTIVSGLRMDYGCRRPRTREPERYRGSIYSLSIPTPYSPTLYVGIDTYVISLDWHSTDDILSNVRSSDLSSTPHSSTKAKANRPVSITAAGYASERCGISCASSTNQTTQNRPTELPESRTIHQTRFGKLIPSPCEITATPILDLSAYLRPRPGHETTDTILLRKQLPWSETVRRWESRPQPRPEMTAADKHNTQPNNNNGPTSLLKASTHSETYNPLGPSLGMGRLDAHQPKHAEKKSTVEPDDTSEEGWDMRWRLARYERGTRQWQRHEDWSPGSNPSASSPSNTSAVQSCQLQPPRTTPAKSPHQNTRTESSHQDTRTETVRAGGSSGDRPVQIAIRGGRTEPPVQNDSGRGRGSNHGQGRGRRNGHGHATASQSDLSHTQSQDHDSTSKTRSRGGPGPGPVRGH